LACVQTRPVAARVVLIHVLRLNHVQSCYVRLCSRWFAAHPTSLLVSRPLEFIPPAVYSSGRKPAPKVENGRIRTIAGASRGLGVGNRLQGPDRQR
jgi:hypothetical protein